MNEVTRNDLEKYYNEIDYKRFEWAICNVMCTPPGPYDTPDPESKQPNSNSFTEAYLFKKTNLGGYMDAKLLETYEDGKNRNHIYSGLMDKVTKRLVSRGLIERLPNALNGQPRYKRTPLLDKNCRKVRFTGGGDIDKDLDLGYTN